MGRGLETLRTEAALAHGQDLDPRLAGPDVRIAVVEEIADKSYDVVTSIDVVEHVQDPAAFVAHLARIAREGFFLTTPNWTASRCDWPFHLREYTPREFEQLLAGHGGVTLFKGTPQGVEVYEVRHRRAFYAFNDLRTWPPTSFVARCINRLVPAPCKIHSHIAAWVRPRGS
jgi:2-polyprenyl-3-methyl-5-hydroxy-6-metoxy-1,4-benzoquinol methylase